MMKKILTQTVIYVFTFAFLLTFFTGHVSAATVTAGTDIASPWQNNTQRSIYFNGDQYVLLYSNNVNVTGFGKLQAKTSPTLAGLQTAQSQNFLESIIGESVVAGRWDVNFVTDTVFDIAYFSAYQGASNTMRTCTVASNGTVGCGNRSQSLYGSAASSNHATVRNLFSDRIWMASRVGGVINVWSADQTGSADMVTSWTQELSMNLDSWGTVELVTLAGSDSVMVVYPRDLRGTKNDGVYSRLVTRGAGGTSTEATVVKCNGCNSIDKTGNAVRITDNDIRYVTVVPVKKNDEVQEFKWNGTNWSVNAVVETASDLKQPSLSYDSYNSDLYAFYVNNSASPSRVYRSTGDLVGNWGGKVLVDAGENTSNVLPISQMLQPAYGAIRCPGSLVWGYLNTQGSLYDMVVGSENLSC